ncbi:MAG: hypothetical protein M9947_14875, partial [Thermomicrobiales bacterium]|nr:hypothetical protein [Thermomicrobiales bacterium]
MNRRRFLQSTVALTGAVWLEEVAAQGTPVASPVASDLPLAYTEVAAEYEAAEARGLELGRAATDLLAAGDAQGLFDRFAPEMQDAVSIEAIEETLLSFTTNRVHFEQPDFHLIFDGQLLGSTISGVLQSSALTPFLLRRSDATPEPIPAAGTPVPAEILAGRWTGATDLPDGTSLSLVVDVSATGQEGTLAIRDQNVADSPLTNIAFHAEQPLGDRSRDWAMPQSPSLTNYGAVFDWAGRGLSVSIMFDADDQIVSMQLAEEWQLAPDPAVAEPPLPPMRLPFDGLWWVFWGGDTVGANYHAASDAQRHAVDLVVWRNGGTFRTDGATNEDYYAWGQPVLAPVDATVVDVVDEYPANTPGQLPEDPPDVFGNHVVLQLGN